MMRKKDWTYKILLLVLDLAILTFVYIVPEVHEDGMTTLVLSFFLSGISFIMWIIMEVFRNRKWSFIFLINTIILFYAINFSAVFFKNLEMRKYYTNYHFEINDSTFSLEIQKTCSEFHIFYQEENFYKGICLGTYTTTNNNEYILEVDSSYWNVLKHLQRFIIRNDSIIDFNQKGMKIKLEKKFF